MNKQGGWMKLDNAAKIYPPVTRGELTSVFRLTAIINAPVKITVLQQSVKEAALLFPSFSVELWQGIFGDGFKAPATSSSSAKFPAAAPAAASTVGRSGRAG